MVTEDPEGAEVAAINEALPLAGCSLLEVGCGGGRLTIQLLAAGARVDGVDPVARLRAKARRRCAGQGARFFRDIPKAKARYDAVLFSHSL